MNQAIIYPKQTSGINLIIPSPDCFLSIDQIAQKDVPTGIPYLIINQYDIPKDMRLFDAWEADFTNPHGFGADHGIGSLNAVIGWDQTGKPILQKTEVQQ